VKQALLAFRAVRRVASVPRGVSLQARLFHGVASGRSCRVPTKTGLLPPLSSRRLRELGRRVYDLTAPINDVDKHLDCSALLHRTPSLCPKLAPSVPPNCSSQPAETSTASPTRPSSGDSVAWRPSGLPPESHTVCDSTIGETVRRTGAPSCHPLSHTPHRPRALLDAEAWALTAQVRAPAAPTDQRGQPSSVATAERLSVRCRPEGC
jgi:hypothetical protein